MLPFVLGLACVRPYIAKGMLSSFGFPLSSRQRGLSDQEQSRTLAGDLRARYVGYVGRRVNWRPLGFGQKCNVLPQSQHEKHLRCMASSVGRDSNCLRRRVSALFSVSALKQAFFVSVTQLNKHAYPPGGSTKHCRHELNGICIKPPRALPP